VGVKLAATLLILKLLVTTANLRARADGGLLTPGLTIGALSGIILGGGWNQIWPFIPPGAFALVGGAAFLAVSMPMPVTTTALIFEFTRADHDFLVPVLLAVSGALAVSRLCENASNRFG
jgi:H+/Cl- antiporter ClcA